MAIGPAASRFRENSLLGISAGLAAALVAGGLCSWANFSQPVTTSVMAFAVAIPAAIELQIKDRRRDTTVDRARIKDGELRRPVGPVVTLLAATILVLDSAVALFSVSGFSALVRASRIGITTAKIVSPFFTVLPVMLLGLCLFLVASYASHYLGNHAYLWTTAAVGCALVGRELVVLGMSVSSMLEPLLREIGESLVDFLLSEAVTYLNFLFVCMAGVWFGRRHHAAFLARKLARMERKALPVATAMPLQTSAPNQITPVNLAPPNPRDRRLE
jgi:hypothetical protein